MTVRLHAHQAGSDAAPPVVLLHAIATSGAMWRPQIQALASAYRVIALDLPGHGRSEAFPARPEIADYADAVLDTLEALGVQRAAVVGLSFGSMIAQHIAAVAPERVAALVLSNGVAFAPDPVRAAWRERAAAAEREGMAAQVEGTLDRWFTPRFRDEPAVQEIGALVAETSLAGYVHAAGVIAALDNRALLPRIQAPTLVLAGEEDAAAPLNAVAEIARAVPNARFASLQAGHLMNVQAASLYNAQLVDFLASAATA